LWIQNERKAAENRKKNLAEKNLKVFFLFWQQIKDKKCKNIL
jgi:hypothetical protein